MAIRDALKQAAFSFRDVPICLNGPLVLRVENAREILEQATKRLRIGEIALARSYNQDRDDNPDGRLAQRSSTTENLQTEVDLARAAADAATATLEALEAEARAAAVVIRFTALPKGVFQKRRQDAGKDGEKLYSDLARETSAEVVNPEAPEAEKQLEPISGVIWDELEPALTAGQWQMIVSALDEINIVEARMNLGFLSKGSATTLN